MCRTHAYSAPMQPTFLPHDLVSSEPRPYEADCQQLHFLTGSIALSVQRPQALSDVHHSIVSVPLLLATVKPRRWSQDVNTGHMAAHHQFTAVR